MNEMPEAVRELAAEREQARRSKDFAKADLLRQRIQEAGFEVTDTPSGPQLTPRGPEAEAVTIHSRSEDVPSRLEEPPTRDVSVQWLVQGWPEDVKRGIEGFDRHCSRWTIQHVVVDLLGNCPELEDMVRLVPEAGWAAGRNAGLRRSAGRLVLLVDGSIEPTGDVIGPLVETLGDPTIGVTGPFGIVTQDLHEFRESEGPDVDAVEGYLMAFRRELVEGGLRFDEKFKFYRTADIELSFRVKAMGLGATVTPVPVIKHEHRMWANTPEHERDRLSKRNFYRFLDRWRGRTDLLVSPKGRS